MSKYKLSFKQQVIEFYLRNGKNRALTRQPFRLVRTTLERYINQYNHHSINWLTVSRTRQVYSPEFKLSVAQAVRNGMFSTRKATSFFSIPEPALISQ